MVKNVIDVIFGGPIHYFNKASLSFLAGLSYWMFGFGMTFGDSWPNPFIGVGKFFFDPDGEHEIVQVRNGSTILIDKTD